MKKVIDMCPFMGLTYIDEQGLEHHRGEGLSPEENTRLDTYFAKFHGLPFKGNQAIELAQMALDNVPIPDGWGPCELKKPGRKRGV
jgi:hypothetical protein